MRQTIIYDSCDFLRPPPPSTSLFGVSTNSNSVTTQLRCIAKGSDFTDSSHYIVLYIQSHMKHLHLEGLDRFFLSIQSFQSIVYLTACPSCLLLDHRCFSSGQGEKRKREKNIHSLLTVLLSCCADPSQCPGPLNVCVCSF